MHRFRWAFCQIEAIRKCIKLSALRQMLKTLPRTLDETYERILSTIESHEQLEDAIRLLQWLCFSKRPQSLQALVDVLATNSGSLSGFSAEERLPDPFDVLTICSSMVAIKEEDTRNHDDPQHVSADPVIQLAHFSVQEYLLSPRCPVSKRFTHEAGHNALAEVTLNYLLHVCRECQMSESGFSATANPAQESLSIKRSLRRHKMATLSAVYLQYPLCKYACGFWYKHAAEVKDELLQNIITKACDLFEGKDSLLEQWLVFHNPNIFNWSKGRSDGAYYTGFRQFVTVRDIRESSSRVSRHGSALFYAAATNLVPVVRKLIESGNVMVQLEDWHPSPLHVAVAMGNVAVAKLLLDSNACADQFHEKAGFPIQIAAASGNLPIVHCLLDAGVTLSRPPCDFTFINPYNNSLTEMNATTLQAACFGADARIVRLLLEEGEQLPGHSTPFAIFKSVALGLEYENEKQADISLSLNNVKTQGLPLLPKLESLLDEGPATDGEPIRDHVAVLRILRESGLEIGNHFWHSYDVSRLKFVHALLDAGYQLIAPNAYGTTLLHQALHDGRPRLFAKIRRNGADIDCVDGLGLTCYDYAANSPQTVQDFELKAPNAIEEAHANQKARSRLICLQLTAMECIRTVQETVHAFDASYAALRHLGRCLIHLQRLTEATTVLQMTMLTPAASEESALFRHRAVCDGCDEEFPAGTLWVCKSCADVDLCKYCFPRYQARTLRAIYLCQGHDFLDIPPIPFDRGYLDVGDEVTQNIKDWLSNLQLDILGHEEDRELLP
jgi:ankyrin repeat protein